MTARSGDIAIGALSRRTGVHVETIHYDDGSGACQPLLNLRLPVLKRLPYAAGQPRANGG